MNKMDSKLQNQLKLIQIRNLSKTNPEKKKSKDTNWKNRKEISTKSLGMNVEKKSLSIESESEDAFKKKHCLL